MGERITGIRQVETLSPKGAEILKNAAVEVAEEREIDNILILVFNREGAFLSGQALGEVNPMTSVIAFEKAKTVLATQRSTSVQRGRMETSGNQREDYGGRLGSLITGGVAVYSWLGADKGPHEFLGVIVCAGAHPAEKDEEICVEALTRAGLKSDVPLAH